MRMMLLAAVAAFAVATPAMSLVNNPPPHSGATTNMSPRCAKGVPCGDTCIPKGTVCHIQAAPKCNPATQKPCGKSCIPRDKTCHKPARTVRDPT